MRRARLELVGVVSDALLSAWLQRLATGRERYGRGQVRLRLGDGRQWLLDLGAGSFRVAQPQDDSLVELRLNELDLLALAKGRMRPEDLYQRGRLWVDGDMALARTVTRALYRLLVDESEGG